MFGILRWAVQHPGHQWDEHIPKLTFRRVLCMVGAHVAGEMAEVTGCPLLIPDLAKGHGPQLRPFLLGCWATIEVVVGFDAGVVFDPSNLASPAPVSPSFPNCPQLLDGGPLAHSLALALRLGWRRLDRAWRGLRGAGLGWHDGFLRWLQAPLDLLALKASRASRAADEPLRDLRDIGTFSAWEARGTPNEPTTRFLGVGQSCEVQPFLNQIYVRRRRDLVRCRAVLGAHRGLPGHQLKKRVCLVVQHLHWLIARARIACPR